MTPMTEAVQLPPQAAMYSSDELAAKVMRQCNEVIDVKQKFFSENASRIVECCVAMADAFDRGAHLLVFGNGGSSCDAAHMAVECMHPIIEKRTGLPAISLNNDTAVLTAIGNDMDFSLAYVKQLKLLGRNGGIALGISTSGKSANVNRALQAAREMNMLTVGYAGRDGGKMPPLCDHCFVVPSFSIPRIQETQETLLHIMWDLIHVIRGAEDVI
ncbi:MAG TPA: SIS domain-containing protein [Pirellulales bacterium]|jgi:D-sedoheptulose 7-phosphate isomerase|nr:SIS domain-containing protein [Pirellulales bacterium]